MDSFSLPYPLTSGDILDDWDDDPYVTGEMISHFCHVSDQSCFTNQMAPDPLLTDLHTVLAPETCQRLCALSSACYYFAFYEDRVKDNCRFAGPDSSFSQSLFTVTGPWHCKYIARHHVSKDVDHNSSAQHSVEGFHIAVSSSRIELILSFVFILLGATVVGVFFCYMYGAYQRKKQQHKGKRTRGLNNHLEDEFGENENDGAAKLNR